MKKIILAVILAFMAHAVNPVWAGSQNQSNITSTTNGPVAQLTLWPSEFCDTV